MLYQKAHHKIHRNDDSGYTVPAETELIGCFRLPGEYALEASYLNDSLSSASLWSKMEW